MLAEQVSGSVARESGFEVSQDFLRFFSRFRFDVTPVVFQVCTTVSVDDVIARVTVVVTRRDAVDSFRLSTRRDGGANDGRDDDEDDDDGERLQRDAKKLIRQRRAVGLLVYQSL